MTGEGNNQMHACVAAYLSDIELSFTCVLPNRDIGIGLMTSLDHSMWFHAPFRSDEWMLYQCESPIAGQYLSFYFFFVVKHESTGEWGDLKVTSVTLVWHFRESSSDLFPPLVIHILTFP